MKIFLCCHLRRRRLLLSTSRVFFLFSEDNEVVKVFRSFIVAVLHKIIESIDMNRLEKLMNELFYTLRMRFSCCHHKKS